MFADAASEICDYDMFRVNGVSIKRRAIMKDGDESRVKGARQMQHIKTNFEAFDP